MRSDTAPASGGRGPEWTPEQRAGIETIGRSVLVSAAAGSGKTAVLAERCAHLVCDCAEPCDVDELLVVTFTEAAAGEMKERIQKALRQRLATSQDPRLQRQMALVERMNVSTLHGFCARLLRQHFHLLGLDPSFDVLDGDEAHLLELEVARTLFDERYEKDESGQFHAFIDAFGDGSDESLLQQVIRTSHTLGSLTDARTWCDTARRRIAEAIEKPLEESELGKALLASIGHQIEHLRTLCEGTLDVMKQDGNFPQYVEVLEGHRQTICHWAGVLADHGLDMLVGEVVDLGMDRLPAIRGAVPGKERAKKQIDAVRSAMKSGPLVQRLQFSSQQWRDGLKIIQPHAEMFLDLVMSFDRAYTTEKQQLRALDFADLERYALRLLCDPDRAKTAPSRVARLLHNQFRYVLVDEYQDINAVQDTILSLVSRECLRGEKGEIANLFSVGDVKQSIYRFRLAEPTLFLDRTKLFRDTPDAGGTVIDLQANFRSRGPLLEAINDVFRLLMVGGPTEVHYDQSHELRPGKPYPDSDGAECFTGAPIELHILPDGWIAQRPDEEDAADGDQPDRTEREALFVARRIRALIDSGIHVFAKGDDGAMTSRPIAYRDIVILLRSMKYRAEQYADILRQSQIPVHSESSTGYFESMEVRDLLALLAVLDNQQQDIPLAAVLRSPLAQLADAEDSLARIRLAYPASDHQVVPFHQAVVRYAHEHDDELAARLRDVLGQLSNWRDMAQRRPLAEVIWTIYDATGYLAFCAGLPDGRQRVANLIDLHERARQFGSFQRQGLSRFLAFLNQLCDQADLGQPAIAGANENVVRIMSIHRSKGLEFPVVFVPDLGKRFNLSDCSRSILVDREAYLGLLTPDSKLRVKYPSLAWTLVNDNLKRQSLAEELRVLYVAMTRAREHLILSGTAGDKAVDSWRQQWEGFDGTQFDAQTVMDANCMLDWLGPVAFAARRGDAGPMSIVTYTDEDLATWPRPETLRPTMSDAQKSLARLEPLSPPPPFSDDVTRIIDRITRPYAFQAYAQLPGAEAVSALAKELMSDKREKQAPATGLATGHQKQFERRLAMPRALAADAKPTPTEIGSATHLVLQHLDFTRPCSPDDVRAQVAELVEKCLITPEQGRMVDGEAIGWFLSQPIGQAVREKADAILRELPVYFPMAADRLTSVPQSNDPLDRIMVRSRVDLLVPVDGGFEVVDYKTDNVNADMLETRKPAYERQMAFYCEGLSAALRQPVRRAHLVFLTPRVVCPVSVSGDGPAA